jgi:hypothetical protein
MVEPPPPPPPEGPPPYEEPVAIPDPTPGLCPNCGAPHDAYQEYCLECGRRLPAMYVGGGGYTTVWRRDSPIWLWTALFALLLVALVAGTVVALAATDDEKQSEPATSIPVVSTAPSTTSTVGVITQPPTITINPPTTSTFSTTTLSTTTLGTTTFGTTTTTGGSATWPRNKDGFTVVLKSVPTSHGRSQADAAADRARSNGLTQVGVLNSSDYRSMNAGYYVTFTGIYDTQGQADAALPNARSRGFPTAYVREVSN